MEEDILDKEEKVEVSEEEDEVSGAQLASHLIAD